MVDRFEKKLKKGTLRMRFFKKEKTEKYEVDK